MISDSQLSFLHLRIALAVERNAQKRVGAPVEGIGKSERSSGSSLLGGGGDIYLELEKVAIGCVDLGRRVAALAADERGERRVAGLRIYFDGHARGNTRSKCAVSSITGGDGVRSSGQGLDRAGYRTIA